MGGRSPSHYRSFPDTRWSLVVNAGADKRRTLSGALNELVSQYRPVLKSHLVYNMRLDPHRADDLLQGFLATRVLEQDLLQRADRDKGRFRTFLLTSFVNYAKDRLRHDLTAKRAPVGPGAVSLDENVDMVSCEPEAGKALNLAWVRHVLDQAIDRMRAECEAKNRTDIRDIFQYRILGPILDGSRPLPYEEIVAKMGFASPSQASNVLISAKRMFKRILTDIVRDTVSTEREVEQELGELKEILSRGI